MANRCYAFFAQCLRFPGLGTATVPCLGTSTVPCLGTFAVPAWDACQYPAWVRLPVPCLGTLASPCLGRLLVPCLGTLTNSLPGNVLPVFFFFFFFFLRTFSSLICHGPTVPCMYILAKNVMPEARAIESDSAAGRSCMKRQAGEQKEMRGKRLGENASQERKGVEGGLSFVASLTRPSKIEGCWCGACVVHASCMWCMRSRRQDVGVACVHDA